MSSKRRSTGGSSAGELTPAGHVETRGRTPRSFAIDPSGRFLLAANSNGTVHVFNLSTGENFVTPISVPGAAVLCHYWRQ